MARIAVVSADGARALDAHTIATLPESYALMRRAALAAAEWLHARPARHAAIFVGPGNNGGDGWLIAGILRGRGWTIAVDVVEPPRTADAIRARQDAEHAGPFAAPDGQEPLVIDAVLGTGATGQPRGAMHDALVRMRERQHAGAEIVAIDLPSALDATSGDDNGAVPAAHTLTFGTIKQGQLLRRDLVGTLHLLDIGLVDAADAPQLVTGAAVREWLPTQPPDAWKGTRGRVAILGGDQCMAGAVILAARGAHAAGAGMVRVDVSPVSQLALQIAAPFATANAADDWDAIDTRWPDAMVIGPGLASGDVRLRDRLLSLLHAFRGPVVLDAGALTAFHAVTRADDGEDDGLGGDPLYALRHALGGREALLTPHVGEFRGLLPGATTGAARFIAPGGLAAALDTTVLLKGVPTVIAAPDGATLVSATGNQALAMGGSGDVLAGIAGALLAQGVSALRAGAMAAWVHGAAAEQAVARHGSWRGVTMELLLHEVSNVWPRLSSPLPLLPREMLELPAVPRQ